MSAVVVDIALYVFFVICLFMFTVCVFFCDVLSFRIMFVFVSYVYLCVLSFLFPVLCYVVSSCLWCSLFS